MIILLSILKILILNEFFLTSTVNLKIIKIINTIKKNIVVGSIVVEKLNLLSFSGII